MPAANPLIGFAAGTESGRTHSVFSFELPPNWLKKSKITEVKGPPLTPSISRLFNSRLIFPYAVITGAVASNWFSTI